MIAIVDYGVNNLASVRNALVARGAEVDVTCDPVAIAHADGVVLPGIGAAATGMAALRERDLEGPVCAAAASGKPFLAICLGMQLLFDRSDEGDVPCLGLLPGTVSLLDVSLKIPQMGWNQVQTRPDLAMWKGLPSDPYVYFVHSYICVPSDPSLISGETDYGERFCSAVACGPIWATQFHPERSGTAGLQIIGNFVAACKSRHRPNL